MAGFGPPPKPNRRRRNLPLGGVTPTRLPSTGRQGPAPKWPLPNAGDTNQRVMEASEWRRVWRKPQALMWEQLDCVDVVARYVRLTVASHGSMMAVEMMKEIRQLEDRLGLSPMSMLRLRWTVDEDEAGTTSGNESNVINIRDRLKAVDSK